MSMRDVVQIVALVGFFLLLAALFRGARDGGAARIPDERPPMPPDRRPRPPRAPQGSTPPDDPPPA